MIRPPLRLAIPLLAALLFAGCAFEDGHRVERYPDDALPTYAGGRYGPVGIGGTGAPLLDPWLAGTAEGRALVLARFDRNHNGEIGGDRAGEANRWFRRFADRNRDGRLSDREIGWGLAEVSRFTGTR